VLVFFARENEKNHTDLQKGRDGVKRQQEFSQNFLIYENENKYK
jgi:hypothetical protein